MYNTVQNQKKDRERERERELHLYIKLSIKTAAQENKKRSGGGRVNKRSCWAPFSPPPELSFVDSRKIINVMSILNKWSRYVLVLRDRTENPSELFFLSSFLVFSLENPPPPPDYRSSCMNRTPTKHSHHTNSARRKGRSPHTYIRTLHTHIPSFAIFNSRASFSYLILPLFIIRQPSRHP